MGSSSSSFSWLASSVSVAPPTPLPGAPAVARSAPLLVGHALLLLQLGGLCGRWNDIGIFEGGIGPLLFVYRRGVMSDGCRELEEYKATEISTKGQPDFFDGGDYLCSQWASYGVFNYVLEKLVRLIHGNNQITSLGAAIGPHNCGPRLNLVQWNMWKV
ncbi:unnamed protein product [Fraxinus pennsylvanica]|uniref:Uncharacterized protein n=1 Tax=Fraxinus pennsylvanica TaxID=56036 RepID=A0AAD2EED6_9LAMI|nr:unnamed protein product [Fraxinus pennsylvanica]